MVWAAIVAEGRILSDISRIEGVCENDERGRGRVGQAGMIDVYSTVPAKKK